VPGYPIRTSSDHSSVDNSPRPIAVSHVLHRLLVPRHPPCALTHFTTTRCSHPLCNTQQTTTPHHTQHHHPPHTTKPRQVSVRCPRQDRPEKTPTHTDVFSGPNSAPSPHTPASTPQHRTHPRRHEPPVCGVPPSHPQHQPPHQPATRQPTRKANAVHTGMNNQMKGAKTPHPTWELLRKEVIQPHLPVRLPCYDFVLIASPTFDRSLPTKEVRPRASGVTNFHDVTGGVYKARERIHRSIADLRLLATPTSRGRVADPDPN
jgi:hypothetical protein